MTKELEDFVKARNNAVIECWESNSIKPLDRFVKEYKEIMLCYDKWQITKEDIKWLTLCEMTWGITTAEVAKYIPNANKKRREIKGRCEK